MSGGAFGWMFPKKLRIRQKQSWDKLPVHNLVYRNDQDNIKWSVLKLDNTKAKCTQSFFQPTILFKFISNATIYLTPTMFISIINTGGCLKKNQNSFHCPFLCLHCSPCLGIMGLRFHLFKRISNVNISKSFTLFECPETMPY